MRCKLGLAVSFGWSCAAEASTGHTRSSSRAAMERRDLMVCLSSWVLLRGRMEHPDDPGAARRGKLDLMGSLRSGRRLYLRDDDRLGLVMDDLFPRGGRGLPLLRSR